jgi:hypothetical protein
MRARFRSLAVGLALVVLAPACLGARTELELDRCGDPGGTCTTVIKTASKVLYQCNAHAHLFFIDQTHQGVIPVCLPPNLNQWTGTPDQITALEAMSQQEYDVAVARFGQDTLLGQIAALKAVDASGANCFIWAAALGDPDSFCNVIDATRDPFCEDATNCAEVDCVPNDCENPTLPNGDINPHACTCNTTIANADDCEFPGATVCIAPD